MKLLVKQTFHQSNDEMKTFYRQNKTQRHFCECTSSKHEQPQKQPQQRLWFGPLLVTLRTR